MYIAVSCDFIVYFYPPGNKTEVVSAGKEEEDAPVKILPVKSSFSALSFIAAEYGESDNSSPCSADSPAALEESCAASEEAANLSSNGFDTSSVPAELKNNVEPQSPSLDSGAEASRSCSTPDEPQLVLDEMTGEMVDCKKPSKEGKDSGCEGPGKSATAESLAEDDDQGSPARPTNPDSGDSTSRPEPMEMEDSKEGDKLEETLGTDMMMSLKDNQDTNRSLTDMSEDSKQVSNLDSALSSWQEESLEGSTALKLVKGPSSIPFGENANSSMPLMGEKSMLEGEISNLSFLDESSQSNSMADKPSRPKRPRRSSVTDAQDSKHGTEDG